MVVAARYDLQMAENVYRKSQVSVCIAAYNHARYLPKCLDSILSQTYDKYEIVVVDDGSEDGSHELLLDYQSRFKDRIRYFWHAGHENRGVSVTSNVAIRGSTGEYVAFIGADDMWYPEKLQHQVAILEESREVAFVYGIAYYMDEHDEVLPGVVGGDVTADRNPLGKMLVVNYAPAMTVVARRLCLDQVGLFDESMDYSDWDLMIKLLSHWRAAYVDKPLARYRVHGKNMSIGIDPKVSVKRNLDVLHGLRRNASSIGGSLVEAENLSILDLQIAFHLFCNGDEAEARMYLDEAYHRYPNVYSDSDSVCKWSSRYRQEFYGASSRHFGFWVASHFPVAVDSSDVRKTMIARLLDNPETAVFLVEQGVHLCKERGVGEGVEDIFEGYGSSALFPDQWKKRILGGIYAARLFECFRAGEMREARIYWRRAVFADPILLTNRGVWSVGMRAFVN